MTSIHQFLQAWGAQKLESMRGGPVKNYVMLVSCLNLWQTRVSNIPNKLVTKGRLMLLGCHHIQSEMGECCSSSFLSFRLPYLIHLALLGLDCPPVLQGLLVMAPHWTCRASQRPRSQTFPFAVKVVVITEDSLPVCFGSVSSPCSLGVKFLSPDTFYFPEMEVVQTKCD